MTTINEEAAWLRVRCKTKEQKRKYLIERLREYESHSHPDSPYIIEQIKQLDGQAN